MRRLLNWLYVRWHGFYQMPECWILLHPVKVWLHEEDFDFICTECDRCKHKVISHDPTGLQKEKARA